MGQGKVWVGQGNAGGTWEGEWVHPRVKTAMLCLGLAVEGLGLALG